MNATTLIVNMDQVDGSFSAYCPFAASHTDDCRGDGPVLFQLDEKEDDLEGIDPDLPEMPRRLEDDINKRIVPLCHRPHAKTAAKNAVRACHLHCLVYLLSEVSV
jgi:hypothetical protein